MKARESSKFKQWWLPLISGIVLILLGIAVFLFKIATYLDLVLFLLIGFFLIGGLRVFYAGYNWKYLGPREWILINGMVELFIVFIPLFFVNFDYILQLYIGFLLLFRSIIGFGVSFNFKKYQFSGWWITLLASGLGIMASFFMIWTPIASSAIVLIYPALTFLFVGISQFSIAFALKTLNKTGEE